MHDEARLGNCGTFPGCFSEVRGFIVPAHWTMSEEGVMVFSADSGGGS